jgi:hypothetical protein
LLQRNNSKHESEPSPEQQEQQEEEEEKREVTTGQHDPASIVADELSTTDGGRAEPQKEDEFKNSELVCWSILIEILLIPTGQISIELLSLRADYTYDIRLQTRSEGT